MVTPSDPGGWARRARLCESEVCRQGAPESPVLWNIVLDNVLGPVRPEWKRLGYGVRLPFLTGAVGDQEPRNQADAGKRATHLAYADDLLLVAKRAPGRSNTWCPCCGAR